MAQIDINDAADAPVAPGPDAALFRRLASQWASGVAVVTTADGQGRPCGCTVTAAASLSIEPLRYLVCMDAQSVTLQALRKTKAFCLNILSRDQADISSTFAGRSSEKFSRFDHRYLASGLPMLEGVLGYVECKVVDMFPGGDHEIIVGDVVGVEVFAGEPLVYFRGAYKTLES